MKSYVVCGLGFGDEGKGHTVAWLTKTTNASTIIRFNGGPQAAHHVVHKGKTHLFAQFGAGMIVDNRVKTFLSKQMVVQPFNLLREAEVHAQNGIFQPLQRLKVDCDCPVVTVWHKVLNRAREISRGKQRLGSVGIGVGETFHYLRHYPQAAITVGDLVRTQQLPQKIAILYQYVTDILGDLKKNNDLTQFLIKQKPLFNSTDITNLLIQVGQELSHCILWEDERQTFLKEALFSETTILEGAQGALLDYEQGTAPYVTKSKTVCSEATKLLSPYLQTLDVKYIGVSRPYMHRHGPGPLPTEAPQLAPILCDRHNSENEWQGSFRVGWFDTVLANYAKTINPELDYVVLTNMDRLSSIKSLKIGNGYDTGRRLSESFSEFLFRAQPVYEVVPNNNVLISKVEDAYQTPILAISAGEENEWRWDKNQYNRLF
ncbi:MAG: adenylosuccinate synthetase [Chloroflexota bacterium]